MNDLNFFMPFESEISYDHFFKLSFMLKDFTVIKHITMFKKN